jgi:hypothetical protein
VQRKSPPIPRRCSAASILLCVATVIAGCTAGSESAAEPPLTDDVSAELTPPRSDGLESVAPNRPEEESVEAALPQRLALAPGVNGEFTAGVWESAPAEWLEVTSRCEDLVVFEGLETSNADGRVARSWIYWRSDDAVPSEQVTVADIFGEFGWGTPFDASLVPPERLSVQTEWIEVVRYDRWPAVGSPAGPGEPAMDPAEGFAFIARTIAPAGFVGAGSVIIGDRSMSDHDPRHFLETLELDLQGLIASCG